MLPRALAAGLGALLASAALAAPARAAGLSAALKAYHRRDFAAALTLAEPLAKKGSPRAQMLMGMINFVGPEGGLRSDLGAAARWFAAARDQKDAEAAFAYAVVLDMGGARPDDLADAMRAAAELGSPAARKRMAVFYMTGAGEKLAKDDAAAARWLTESAADGYVPARYLLGQCYQRGRLFPADPVSADLWLRLAANAPVVNPIDEPLSMSKWWPAREKDAAQKSRAALEKTMTPAQLAAAEKRVRDYRAPRAKKR